MTEYADEKDQKWNELKLKWSTSSLIKPKIHKNPKSSLNDNKIESKSFSDVVNLLQNQLEKKQTTLKEIQSNDLLDDLEKKIPSPKQWGLMISPDRSISSEHFNQN